MQRVAGPALPHGSATPIVGVDAPATRRGEEAMALTKKIEVIVFPGGNNWPHWAAQAQGFYAGGGAGC